VRHAKDQLVNNKKSYGFDPSISYGLQPMTDIHLHPLYRKAGTNIETGVVNGSTPVYSWLFTGIAAFILLMACINFINISIANSLKRSKEVGVRKITGGSKAQIIGQFLLESSIVCLIAYVTGLLLTNLLLPVFNRISGKEIALQQSTDASLILLLTALFSLVVILSGLYPAIALARFKATKVLYGRQQLTGRHVFGKTLVVIQFSLAVFLVIASSIYYRQMEFVRKKDLGYDPHNILRTYISGNHEIKPIITYLKTEFSKVPSIKKVSFGSGGDINIVADAKINDQLIETAHAAVDENYLEVMGIPLKTGRNFSPALPTDQLNSIIVNESFVKTAKLSEPLGTIVYTNDYFDKEPKTIIGVVKDFHYGSLKQRIQPLALLMKESFNSGILVKYDMAAEKQAVAAVERIIKQAIPNGLYEYYFVDQLSGDYFQEERWLQIVSIATIISLIICCMGLFGLASLAVSRRTREIGIRKILGAGVANITGLVCMDFVRLVTISIVIAVPIAAFVMKSWLENFAYRTPVHWWIYLIAGSSALLIAILTVSVQAVRAALSNPVKHLRTE
jgi:putative ABC transport system permease protein